MPHIHFIGIGGAGIGPIAEVAKQAGYDVSGSDLKDSDYIKYLKSHGIDSIQIGEEINILRQIHKEKPIDWLVYTSALSANQPNPPVLSVAKELGIKTSKRDEFLNQLIKENNLKLIAISGTHGKTTTTAMVVWLFKQLGLKVSYVLPAKVSFGVMGEFERVSQYFVYEADEFDRNFLSFSPGLSLITGISWDHHEIYKTKEEYEEAFKQFISQSKQTILWQSDADKLTIEPQNAIILVDNDPQVDSIKLNGLYNRRDAYLSVNAISQITGRDQSSILNLINDFPGLSRRMEQIIPNLYTDYAHTPEKIKAAIYVASDMVKQTGQKIVIVYEPLTNRRQTYIKDEYKDSFKGASKVYWLDSYLAREDPTTAIISPDELIGLLTDPSLAVSAKKDENLKKAIQNHLDSGDLVICMAGGGGGSLDEWLRGHFKG